MPKKKILWSPEFLAPLWLFYSTSKLYKKEQDKIESMLNEDFKELAKVQGKTLEDLKTEHVRNQKSPFSLMFEYKPKWTPPK